MSSFKEDFNYVWNKPDNGLVRIILINVAFFVAINIVFLFFKSYVVSDYLQLPSDPMLLLMRPWTLVTHFFTHKGFGHIFWNLIMVYWFGQIFISFSGNRKMIALYILGGLAGGIAYFITGNLIPSYIPPGSGALGASAAVMAITLGAATIAPDYRIHLFFIGAAKLKYIAAVTIFLSLLGLHGMNAGGEVAHLAGALMGFVFVQQLKKGNDLSTPILAVLDWFVNLAKPKSKMKVSYRGKSKTKKGKAAASGANGTNQAEVDRILDKISESGYDKLTKEEKQILFQASQKKGQGGQA